MPRLSTRSEVADLIERFLENRLRYTQEWNDFVECPQKSPEVEGYRKLCYELDPFVNRPDPIDEDAIADLRGILGKIRGGLG